jgi:hypothetical protein
MSEKIIAGKERRYLGEEWLLFCIHGKNDVPIKDLGVTLFAQKAFGKELCQMVNYNLLQDTNQVLVAGLSHTISPRVIVSCIS